MKEYIQPNDGQRVNMVYIQLKIKIKRKNLIKWMFNYKWPKCCDDIIITTLYQPSHLPYLKSDDNILAQFIRKCSNLFRAILDVIIDRIFK